MYVISMYAFACTDRTNFKNVTRDIVQFLVVITMTSIIVLQKSETQHGMCRARLKKIVSRFPHAKVRKVEFFSPIYTLRLYAQEEEGS